MSALKKVLAKVVSPTASPTATSHSLPVAQPASPTSPNGVRSQSPDSAASGSRRTSTDGSTRDGRKANRMSTLISHIRSHSATGKARDPLPTGAVSNGVAHDDTVHSHEIVRPNTQRRLSMTEEKEDRKHERELKEEREAEERRRRHLEAWKNVCPLH